MYFLGIDTNVQRTQVAALDLELAAIVAEAGVRHQSIGGLPEGHREQDPAVWIAALDQAVKQCLGKLGDSRRRVAGIGVGGMQHGMVVLDGDNRILRPSKLSGDLAAVEECDEICEAFGGPPGLIEMTGNVLRPWHTASLLLWLKKREPYHFQKVSSVLLAHEFVNYWLTGLKRAEYGDASGSGFMDVRARTWSRELVEFIDPRLMECLPPLCSSRGAHGRLRSDLAEAWGLEGQVVVSSGGGAAMMEAIGAGNVENGGVTVSLGTTGRVSAVSAVPIIDPRGEVSAFCDGTDQWMPTVAWEGATEPMEMVASTFGWGLKNLEEVLMQGPGGAGGLMFLSVHEHGEGAMASSFLHGMTRENYTPVNLARASAEGVALEFGHALQRIVELGFEPSQVHVTGDWSRSPVWRQLVADVLGLPVVAAKGGDGVALGLRSRRR